MVVQRMLMGEGVASSEAFSQSSPSPILFRCSTELPSPARGEGANATASLAAGNIAAIGNHPARAEHHAAIWSQPPAARRL
jgi:hypothetical protein